MLWVHIGIASLRQFYCVPTTYDSGKNEENHFEIDAYQVSYPLYLPLYKHAKLPINVKIPVSIRQIVYIYMTSKSMRGSRNFRQGGPGQSDKKKSSDNFLLLLLLFFFGPQLILQKSNGQFQRNL